MSINIGQNYLIRGRNALVTDIYEDNNRTLVIWQYTGTPAVNTSNITNFIKWIWG